MNEKIIFEIKESFTPNLYLIFFILLIYPMEQNITKYQI